MNAKPLAIANSFIEKAVNAGKPVTMLQVIRLTYITHGYYLAMTGEPLIKEKVEAWTFGVMFPSLHRKLMRFQADPIYHQEPETLGFDIVKPSIPKGTFVDHLIDKVWEEYKDIDYLKNDPGDPWSKLTQNGQTGGAGTIISNNLIMQHYVDLMIIAAKDRTAKQQELSHPQDVWV